MLTNSLRIFHSIVILIFIYKIIHNQFCTPILFGIQISLTLLRALLEKKLFSRHTRVQIIASMVLGYLMFPNKAYFLSWIYLVKGIQIHQSLKAFRKSFFQSSNLKYVAFVFDIIRFTISEYVFFAIVMLVYKFSTDCTDEPIPEAYVVMYQLAVTASTIGYGDVTPKSKHQMIFLTYTIPFICASFAIYTNCMVEVYTNTFLVEEEKVTEQIKQKTD